jgi:hypothetical protein
MSALPSGYQLDEYTIDSVLGFGEFGITYKAVDTKDRLETNVAIKEFFPRHFAVRSQDRVTVALQRLHFIEPPPIKAWPMPNTIWRRWLSPARGYRATWV